MKLDQYYSRTEDSPAYLASLVLHPAFRWSTIESQWSDHPDWLVRGKAAVQELWEEYRTLPVEQDTILEQSTVARKTTDLDDFMASIRKLSTHPAASPSAMRDEYVEWVATTDPGDCLVDDPVQYCLRSSAGASFHDCRGWPLISFQFRPCPPSRSVSLVSRGRWSPHREADSKQILSVPLNVYRRVRKVGLSRYPNRSKSNQIRSNQIRSSIWAPKLNQIGGRI